MTDTVEIAVTINGRVHRLTVPPRRVLADVLREDLQLLGCKIGCDQAVCGACVSVGRQLDRDWRSANIL